MDAANLAYRYTQNMEGSWSVPNALFNSQWGKDNPDWLQSVESPLYGEQSFEDVVTVLAPLPEHDGQNIGFRSTAVGDYLVVQPKVTPGAEECVPTYLRVAGMGFDLIQETDLGTPDPSMSGASSRQQNLRCLAYTVKQLTRWALIRGLTNVASAPQVLWTTLLCAVEGCWAHPCRQWRRCAPRWAS
jgi:hypothetical protein